MAEEPSIPRLYHLRMSHASRGFGAVPAGLQKRLFGFPVTRT